MDLGAEAYVEVPGDWSHLSEWDRPPKYALKIHPGLTSKGFDKSETRGPVKRNYPGKDIAELKGRHSGRCAVLFNGPSMGLHDLFKITVPTIGMNRTYVGYPTYKGPPTDYYCAVDHCWLDKPEVMAHPFLINGSTHLADRGYRIVRHPRFAPFSFDLARDGYVAPIPATTGHLSLQLAVYLGFTEIHAIGWDLKGGHFDGTAGSLHLQQVRRYHRRQVEPLTKRGIQVFVCGAPDSAIDFWPHSDFEAVCA